MLIHYQEYLEKESTTKPEIMLLIDKDKPIIYGTIIKRVSLEAEDENFKAIVMDKDKNILANSRVGWVSYKTIRCI